LLLSAVRADLAAGVTQASVTPPPLRYSDLLQPIEHKLPEHSLLLTLEKNDTLASVLTDGGLSRGDTAAIAHRLAEAIDVRRLRPGQIVRFHYDGTGIVDSVQLKLTGFGTVAATRTDVGFEVKVDEAEIREVETVISAEIDHSLYEALRRAGEGPQLAQQLADVFQWDIDFFELQRGDSFSVVVTKRFADDDAAGYGAVTAARFRHKGVEYEAFRHVNADGRAGYYTAEGRPMRKQFLKAPLKFPRVTSGFTKKRFHPVLKYFRPHYGVDYGAPTGTPVMTTADGVVIEARYKTGEGNFVRIRHTSSTETCYLHLSRFAKGIKKGSRVTQGDVIGYVGKTGLATGPHLDYRVKQNGHWIDPLKLKSITPDPLRADALRRFKASVARLQPQLAAAQPVVAEKDVQSRALF
jgi:murein DD-endopeptidase MepM/ murein hydrolase activator NlpD